MSESHGDRMSYSVTFIENRLQSNNSLRNRLPRPQIQPFESKNRDSSLPPNFRCCRIQKHNSFGRCKPRDVKKYPIDSQQPYNSLEVDFFRKFLVVSSITDVATGLSTCG